MKNDFAFAVENSTANFIPKNNLVCGSVEKLLPSLINDDGAIINLCFNSGWFALAGNIKGVLGAREVISFCLNDGKLDENELDVLLSSVTSVGTVIVTGSEELAMLVCKKYQAKKVKIIYLPLDFNYEFFIKHALEIVDNRVVLLDEKILAKCNRSAFVDCVRRILARKILSVEIAVNQAITGDKDKKQIENILDESKKYLQKYLQTHLIVYLVISHLLSIVYEHLSGVEYIPSVAGEVLAKLNYSLSLRGEREYLIYKMILRLYKFYFTNDTSFLLKRCGIAIQEEQINKLMSDCCLLDYSLPKTAYLSDNEIDAIKQKIYKDKKVIELLDNYLLELENEAQILKKEFGGRKYTVEHYNAKERAIALNLTPYLIKNKTAYELLFASGIIEYFA
ncbi:MAG: hypothetical protein IKJ19_04870 [Clostridia bacterium]|nr:hypothetical protein [Clostridia bacterium]